MSAQEQNFNLNELKPAEIASHEKIKEKFVDILKSIHKKSDEEAASIYEKEALYFKKALAENDRLRTSTNVSLFSAFIEVAVNCLSIQGGAKSEAYLQARSTKSQVPDGNGGVKDGWVNVAQLSITAYGELSMRIRSGQIIRMSNPQVIYEGDTFQPYTTERGELTVEYKPCIPRKSSNIIGCYVCVVLPNNGLDFKWMLQDDIDRLRKASAKQNKGTANALYGGTDGQIDTGFLEAKTIKHAMRAYSKLRLSDSVVVEDEEPTTNTEEQIPAAPVAFGAEEPKGNAEEPKTVQFASSNNEPF
ncbi:MAG: hypothetical protein ACRCZB_08320 [Bacteroidales bacterium]